MDHHNAGHSHSPLPYVCAQCGKPCRTTFAVTRHRSVLPVALAHPLKSWYAVRVGECCIGPDRLPDEDKRIDLARMTRREVQS